MGGGLPSSTVVGVVNARLWRFCGPAQGNDSDARGGNHPACPGMSLFTVEQGATIETKGTQGRVCFDAAMQHAKLLNSGSGWPKNDEAAPDARVLI